MLAAFTPDAEMAFEGVPVGPFVGRNAIEEAYKRQPPDDEVQLLGMPHELGGRIVCDYAWASDGRRAGQMILTPHDGMIERLIVTFE